MPISPARTYQDDLGDDITTAEAERVMRETREAIARREAGIKKPKVPTRPRISPKPKPRVKAKKAPPKPTTPKEVTYTKASIWKPKAADFLTSDTPAWFYNGKLHLIGQGNLVYVKEPGGRLSYVPGRKATLAKEARKASSPEEGERRRKAFEALPYTERNLTYRVEHEVKKGPKPKPGRAIIEQSLTRVLGEGSANVKETWQVGEKTYYELKDGKEGYGRVVVWDNGRLEQLEGLERLTALAIKVGKLIDKPASDFELKKQKVDRGLGGKIADALSEAMTFGKVETETFNRESLGQKFEKAKVDLGRSYDVAVKLARYKNKQVVETKEEFTNRVLGGKERYVDEVLKVQPQLKSIAKEVGLASIPIYGTIRTWQDSPNWVRGLSVAADIATIIPVVGMLSAGARGGIAITKTAGRIAIAEIKAPITAVRHPLRTLKGAVEPIETLLHPRKIPIAAAEVSTHTIRIPARPKFKPTPGAVKVPEEVLTGVKSSEVMRARDTATLRAIRGEKAVAPLGMGEITITQPSLQRVTTPAAIHASPDIRNFMVETVVKAGEEGRGLFLSPGLQTRFTRASAFGRDVPLAWEAERLVALGKLPDKPVPGAVIIRDPKLLSSLEESGKLYRGTAEIETTLKPGTKLPAPSQVLFTRDAAGDRIALAIIGNPLSPAEIAKLKFVGSVDTVKSIFRGVGRFKKGSKVSGQVDTAIEQAKKASRLTDEADEALRSGDIFKAQRLRSEARATSTRAEIAFRNANVRAGLARVSFEPIALYHGRQDIRAAFRQLSEPTIEVRKPLIEVTEEERVVPLDEERIVPPRAEEVRPLPPPSEERITPPEEKRPPPPPEEERVFPPPPERTPPPPPPEERAPPPPIKGKPVVPKAREYVPPRERVIGRIPKLPKGYIRVEGRVIPKRGAVAWRQGVLYIVMFPPYGRKNTIWTDEPPIGIRMFKGPDSAYKSITRLGGKLPGDLKLELGIFSVDIIKREGAQPGLKYSRLKGVRS